MKNVDVMMTMTTLLVSSRTSAQNVLELRFPLMKGTRFTEIFCETENVVSLVPRVSLYTICNLMKLRMCRESLSSYPYTQRDGYTETIRVTQLW